MTASASLATVIKLAAVSRKTVKFDDILFYFGNNFNRIIQIQNALKAPRPTEMTDFTKTGETNDISWINKAVVS